MITDKQSTRRNTRQRDAILELLASTKTHPTAIWLYEHLKTDNPDISLGTVYRNLSLLASQGRILVIESKTGTDRFDADTSEHYHVICERCGRVDDVGKGFAAPKIRDTDAARATGYHIVAHRLDFFGICPDCLLDGSGKNGSVEPKIYRREGAND
jgi:Fur family transcriptional regulator, peroxide stress response regulator